MVTGQPELIRQERAQTAQQVEVPNVWYWSSRVRLVGLAEDLRRREIEDHRQVDPALRNVGAWVADLGVCPVNHACELAAIPDRVAWPEIVVHQGLILPVDVVYVLGESRMDGTRQGAVLLRVRPACLELLANAISQVHIEERQVETIRRYGMNREQCPRQLARPRPHVARKINGRAGQVGQGDRGHAEQLRLRVQEEGPRCWDACLLHEL